jgi:hypothetical protein
MKTTHPTDPLPFNEWAKYIRIQTDLQYKITKLQQLKRVKR